MSATNYLDQYVLQGGITMVALIPLSLYTLALIVQRFIDLRKSRIVAAHIVSRAAEVKDQASFNALREALRSDPAPLAAIVLDYIEDAERGESIDPKENSIPIENETDHLYQSLTPISTSYVIAPLLGVLGTTVGIMDTFQQFATTGRRDMSALVAAIDKSLITTMWGLIIAVPAYFCFAMLQRRIYRYERRILPSVVREVNRHLAPHVVVSSKTARAAGSLTTDH